MTIDIAKIYEANILGKYDETNRQKFETDFSPKEREMWNFTLYLLKDAFPKTIYNEAEDTQFLKGYLDLYLFGVSDSFTLSEWFAFLSSRQP